MKLLFLRGGGSSPSSVKQRSGGKLHRSSTKVPHTPDTESESISVVGHRPTVFMDEDGAEVTLGLDPAGKSRRRRRRRRPKGKSGGAESTDEILHDLTDNSLLDMESPTNISPTPATFKCKLPIQLCCNTSGSWACLSEDSSHSLKVANPQKQVERMISILLSDPIGMEAWCHGWQAWSYLGSGGNIPSATSPSSSSSAARIVKDDLRRVLRNRAFDMNARRYRMQTLRHNLRPFDDETTKGTVSRPLLFERTRSLPISALRSTRPPPERDTTSRRLSSVWDTMQSCTQPFDDSSVWPDHQVYEVVTNLDVCYDSDPEDFGYPASGKNPLKNQTNHLLSSMGNMVDKNNKENSLHGKLFASTVAGSLMVDSHDDASVREIVQELMNGRYTLIWHCCDSSRRSKVGAPLAVTAWFERGQQLQSSLIQPKLMWQAVHQPTQRSVLDNSSNNNADLYSTDLLDITRVVEVDRIDRQHYPLAKLSNSFYITTLDQIILLEAKTEMERNWLVHGLKLMVARLGSKILVEEHDVFDEYFTISLESMTGHDALRWDDSSY